jgi:DNA-directed RNA polymerase specialized sigma24 family protein
MLLVDDIPAPRQITETQDLKRHVAEGSASLPWQEEGVLTRYDDEEFTMQEIGQIHTKAILHVRAALHA